MAENMEGREGPAEVNSRRSDVWQHFIRSKRGDGKDVATCKRCQKSLGAEAKNGTAHLRRHVGTCNGGNPQKRPRPSPPSPQPQPQRPAGGDDPDSSLVHPAAAVLAQMVGFHGYPSSIVEDECFRSFVSVLNPQFQMPSRAAIEGICRLRAKDAMDQLKETLESNQGKISLATGTSHTVQGKALYMAWQFIDDEWTLQKRIAQVFPVVPFPPYHHDTLLGSKEVSIELDEGILEQLSCATTTPTLKEAVLRWVLPDRIFSVAWGEELEEHLEQKDFLKDLCAENQFSEVLDVPQVFLVTYTSDVLNSAADSIFSKLENSFVESCFKAVKALTLSQEQREQMLSDLGLKDLGRYDKRWFSYYCALEVLHKAYSDKNNAALVEQQEFNASRIRELLKRFKHSDAELRDVLGLSRFKESILTELLRKILGMIYHALVAISLPRCCPTSNICLQELKRLKDALQSEAEEASQVPYMAAAYAKIRGFGRDHDIDSVLEKAQGVVDKFLKDSYQYLSIPVVLDPRFKMEYIRNTFEDVFEESEAEKCIEKVMQTIQYLCDEHGRRMRHNISGEGTSSSAEARTSTAADSILGESVVELQRYLQDGRLEPGEGDDGGSFDILQWWRTNNWRYPTLARMARDALAMPASDILSPEDASAVRSMVSWPYGNQ